MMPTRGEFMKLLVLVFLSLFHFYAVGAPCAALDYQEMKEMKPEELVEAYCQYRTIGSRNFQQANSNDARAENLSQRDLFMRRSADRDREIQDHRNMAVTLRAEAEQCAAQQKRLLRIIEQSRPPADEAKNICGDPKPWYQGGTR